MRAHRAWTDLCGWAALQVVVRAVAFNKMAHRRNTAIKDAMRRGVNGKLVQLMVTVVKTYRVCDLLLYLPLRCVVLCFTDLGVPSVCVVPCMCAFSCAADI